MYIGTYTYPSSNRTSITIVIQSKKVVTFPNKIYSSLAQCHPIAFEQKSLHEEMLSERRTAASSRTSCQPGWMLLVQSCIFYAPQQFFAPPLPWHKLMPLRRLGSVQLLTSRIRASVRLRMPWYNLRKTGIQTHKARTAFHSLAKIRHGNIFHPCRRDRELAL